MPKGYSQRNQGGWSHSKKSRELMSQKRKGLTANEKNPRWRGDEVSYQALHNWVRNHFLRPEKCEGCGIKPRKDTLGRSMLHWANKTGKYLRERKDWLCLCAKCHRNFDVTNKKKHRYAKR